MWFSQGQMKFLCFLKELTTSDIISMVLTWMTWSLGRCQQVTHVKFALLLLLCLCSFLCSSPPPMLILSGGTPVGRTSLGVRQVEETSPGLILKAALLSSTHLPAAWLVHLLHAWSNMFSARSHIRADMRACILKWWLPPTSSLLTWCNYWGVSQFQTFDSSEACKGPNQICFASRTKCVWEDSMTPVCL